METDADPCSLGSDPRGLILGETKRRFCKSGPIHVQWSRKRRAGQAVAPFVERKVRAPRIKAPGNAWGA